MKQLAINHLRQTASTGKFETFTQPVETERAINGSSLKNSTTNVRATRTKWLDEQKVQDSKIYRWMNQVGMGKDNH